MIGCDLVSRTASRVGLVTLVLAALWLATMSMAAAATPGWVDTGGDCLRMRVAPGLGSTDITCIDHGERITLLDGVEPRDGFTWQQIEYDGRTGWVADFYITTDPDDVQVIVEAAPASGFVVPPEGGLTFGVASEASPAALVAAQPFPVSSVFRFDITTQRMQQFFPDGPAFTNSLTALTAGDVVILRRTGGTPPRGVVPAAPLTVAGTPRELSTPPIGGMTVGVSGTTDPRFLVQAQSFTVESVWYFHVEAQTWLSYRPEAPAWTNSLQQGHLRTDSVVFVSRGPDALRPVPTSEESDYFETSITYYFCVPGSNSASHGDGGGYCGATANGEQVADGVAACAPRHLGQRFTIEGDPTGRTYTCADTGGSVLQDHRDIWFMNSDDGYAWWVEVGERAFIRIVGWDRAS